jgi:hypothetical protein
MDKPSEKPGGTPEAQPPLSPKGRALIEKAQGHELGRNFLLEGDPESVAVIHGVHPFVVNEVRDFLARTSWTKR